MGQVRHSRIALNIILKQMIILRFLLQTEGGPMSLFGDDLPLYAAEIRRLKHLGCLSGSIKGNAFYDVTENGCALLQNLQMLWALYQWELDEILARLPEREWADFSRLPPKQQAATLQSRSVAQFMVLTYVEKEPAYSEAIHRYLRGNYAMSVSSFQVSNCVARLTHQHCIEGCKPPESALFLSLHQRKLANFFQITPEGRQKLTRLRTLWSQLKERLPQRGPLSLPLLRSWFLES